MSVFFHIHKIPTILLFSNQSKTA